MVSQTSCRWCLPDYRTADALIKADPTRTYTETCLHRAVALNGLKDLDGALTSVKEARKLDPQHKRLRVLMARRKGANIGAMGGDQGATRGFANSTRRLSPHLRMRSRTAAAVKGAPDFGAAERTLDCEDCSEKMTIEGKGG